MRYHTKNKEETKALAGKLHKEHPEHTVWLLYGDLGTGKTTLVKGLGEALGLNSLQVKSPTYTLVNEHDRLIHYDLYRIEQMDDLTLEQLEEHMAEQTPLVIEWPEKVESSISKPHLRIQVRHLGGDEREILVEQYEAKGFTLPS